MWTWTDGERALRREAAVALRESPGATRPVIAVGDERPSGVISVRGLDPDRPSRTLAALVMLAAEFRPSRVVVALPVGDPADGRKGTMLVHDVQLVADGRVELLRAWRWRRLAGRVLWLPVEVRRWQVRTSLLSELAQTVLEERPVDPAPERLRALVRRHLADGHGVRLSPALSAYGAPDGW
jgi:hypothetical protein